MEKQAMALSLIEQEHNNVRLMIFSKELNWRIRRG
jgi:hypothetical protein